MTLPYGGVRIATGGKATLAMTMFYRYRVPVCEAKNRHRWENGGDSLILLFSYRGNVPIHSQ